MRTLTQECDNPKPSHGGKDCPSKPDAGSKVESDNCSKLSLIPKFINKGVTRKPKQKKTTGVSHGKKEVSKSNDRNLNPGKWEII